MEIFENLKRLEIQLPKLQNIAEDKFAQRPTKATYL